MHPPKGLKFKVIGETEIQTYAQAKQTVAQEEKQADKNTENLPYEHCIAPVRGRFHPRF